MHSTPQAIIAWEHFRQGTADGLAMVDVFHSFKQTLEFSSSLTSALTGTDDTEKEDEHDKELAKMLYVQTEGASDICQRGIAICLSLSISATCCGVIHFLGLL
jgi:hypothetical protein